MDVVAFDEEARAAWAVECKRREMVDLEHEAQFLLELHGLDCINRVSEQDPDDLKAGLK